MGLEKNSSEYGQVGCSEHYNRTSCSCTVSWFPITRLVHLVIFFIITVTAIITIIAIMPSLPSLPSLSSLSSSSSLLSGVSTALLSLPWSGRCFGGYGQLDYNFYKQFLEYVVHPSAVTEKSPVLLSDLTVAFNLLPLLLLPVKPIIKKLPHSGNFGITTHITTYHISLERGEHQSSSGYE